MASPKALAAIALTLIVAMPILLGFAMASENVSYNEWETESKSNLSNLILNNETPIYGTYDGPNNNLYLQDVSGTPPSYDRVIPAYNEVSPNYTSLPEYSTSLDTYNLTAATTSSYTLSSQSIGNSTSDATYILSESPYQLVTVSPGTYVRLDYEKTSGTGGWIYRASVALMEFSITYTDTCTISVAYNDTITVISDVDTWKITAGTATVSVLNRGYTDLNINTDYSAVCAGALAVKITHTDSTVEYYSQGENTYSTLNYNSPGFFHIKSNGTSLTYQNVSKVSVARAFSFLDYTEVQQTGDYVVISDGWELPASAVVWYNNFENEAIRMMVMMNDADSLGLTVPGSNTTVTLAKTSGSVSVNGNNLGSYTYLMVEVLMDKIIVSGLSSWPAMGLNPSTLNTITVDYTAPLSAPFEEIEITSSGSPSLRVDLASVAMGSFPSTLNYTLNMNGLFPGKSYRVKLNSIGIYGDTISIGSDSFTVTNGRVTVGGETVPLKGTIITSRYNGSNYDVYLGSHKLGTSASPASIYFGGEWSLTVTADILKQVTGEKAQWVPGGFAFDKDAFVGVLVLAAALTFIGVGMYGARSGLKAGLLLMICGGAALIALTI